MKVVKLNDFKKEKKVDEELIFALKELLAKAEKGEIQTFLGIKVNDDSLMESFMFGRYKEQCISVIGMLEDVKLDLLRMRNGEDV